MPVDYAKYPANWKTYISPTIRTKRAKNRCENPICRARNRKPHPVTGSAVVLTVAHLDHDPSHNDGMEDGSPFKPVEESNLRAWCQRCHNRYDAAFRAANRKRRRPLHKK